MKKLKFVVVLLVMMIIISGCIDNHNDINEEKNKMFLLRKVIHFLRV